MFGALETAFPGSKSKLLQLLRFVWRWERVQRDLSSECSVCVNVIDGNGFSSAFMLGYVGFLSDALDNKVLNVWGLVWIMYLKIIKASSLQHTDINCVFLCVVWFHLDLLWYSVMFRVIGQLKVCRSNDTKGSLSSSAFWEGEKTT